MRLTGKRRIALLGAALALASGPLAAAAPASATAALSMRDLLDVSPEDGAPQPSLNYLVPGETGTLLQAGSTGSWTWLGYASGAPVPVSVPGTFPSSTVYEAGGDRVGVWTQAQNVLDVGTPTKNDWTRVTLPSGTWLSGLHGSQVLVSEAGPMYEILDYDAQGNITSTRALQGLPTGAALESVRPGDDAILLLYATPDHLVHWGLVDWATGTFHAAPGDPDKGGVTLDHDSFIDDEFGTSQQSNGKVVYSVAQLLAGGTPSPVGTTAPVNFGLYNPRVIGGQLYTYAYSSNTLIDLPLDGSPQRVVATNLPSPGWGPGNIAVGRTVTGATYSIAEYTAAADGTVTSRTLYTPPVPTSHFSHLALNSGVLNYQRDWQSQPTTVSLTPGADAVAGPVDMTLGWGLPAAGSGLPAGTLVQRDAKGVQLRTVDTGGACTPTAVEATSRWLYWSCGAAAAAGVVDLGTGTDVALPSEPDNTVLSDGYLLAEDPSTGNLLLTDFHSGTAAGPVTVGTAYQGLGAASGTSWTVDPHTGWFAYEGAVDRALHVVDPGVSHSPDVAAISADHSAYYSGLAEQLTLSRPVTAWRAVLVDKRTGRQAAVLTGGAEHQVFRFDWNGRLPNGWLAFAGDYTLTVSAVPVGDTAFQTVGAWTVTLANGAVGRHVYSFGTRPDLLAMRTASGGSTWWVRSNSGALVRDPSSACRSGGSQVGLPLHTVIPITQQEPNGANDMLAVDSHGFLVFYPEINEQLGGCPENAYATVIGTGWDAYTSVTSPGDLNRDGHDDLVARDKTGVLWFYAGLGKGHFRPRVRIGAGWNSYTHLIGAGDLNGDGNGDLLAVDAAGNLYRFNGNGHGAFAGCARVGSGFNAYRDIVSIGDWNGDGTYDLLTRDRAGYLWLYDGTGTGSFQPRTRIGGFGSNWAIF